MWLEDQKKKKILTVLLKIDLYVGVAFTKVFEIDLEALAMITELNAR